MNKQHYLLTINKWKQEKNLARLVYRIIRLEEDEECLSYVQICNRVKNFIYTKQQYQQLLVDRDNEIEQEKLKYIEQCKAKGYTKIYFKDYDLHYTDVNGKSYFCYCGKAFTPIEMKYNKLVYSDDIKEAINKVLNANWIKEVKIQSRYSGTGDIIKGSYITKYKATK